MRRRSRTAGLLAVTLAGAAVLSGCAGVPGSSTAQRIEQVPVGPIAAPKIHPVPGESARSIVTQFLAANSIDPKNHTSARQFLTGAANNRWNDATATIVADENVGTFRPGRPQVVVTGRVVGTLDANGIFTPSAQGVGNGGARVKFAYGVTTVAGEYRIDALSKGLLMTVAQFQAAYRRRALYFFDLANRYLVPDVRWSALDGPTLAQWLVTELAAGPAPQLQSAVSGDDLPQLGATQQQIVTPGTPMRIDIAGSSQLEAAGRDRLAAQIGTTLNDAIPGAIFTITDNNEPVQIPAARSTQFSAGNFSRDLNPRVPTPAVYYLRHGHIVDSRGHLLPGRANDGRLGYLVSVAVHRWTPTSELSFAGVTAAAGPAGNRLLVGTQSGGFVTTSVHGTLTRPAFAPGLDEAWVGDGSHLYRVLGASATPGRHPQVVPVPVPSLQGRRIVALRFSPEGSRLAMIVSSPDGHDQLYLAAVVRSAGQVRVELPPAPISPEGVDVSDVAWIEPLSLISIGRIARSGESRVFTSNVDGSFWSDSSIGNLPPHPDSVTVATGHLVWVSANKTVWYQSVPEQWTSPGPTGETYGYAPVYLN